MAAEPLETLFNLDLNLAVLRAEAGDESYRSWLDRRPSYDSDEARSLGLAHKPLDALFEDLPKLSGRHLRHARGTVAMAIPIAAGASRERDVALWSQLARELPDFRLDPDELRGFDPKEAYLKAAFASSCEISNLECSFSFDLFEVTTVALSFDVNRRFANFVLGYDPRMWNEVAPEAFSIADEIAEADRTLPIPGSIGAPPPPRLPTPAEERARAGKSGEFPLYERAVTAAGGGGASEPALSDFRNILAIKYHSAPAEVRMTYTLSEPITMIITGSETAGGLDRDSGSALIQELSPVSTHISAI
jgi:hypothetical protein